MSNDSTFERDGIHYLKINIGDDNKIKEVIDDGKDTVTINTPTGTIIFDPKTGTVTRKSCD